MTVIECSGAFVIGYGLVSREQGNFSFNHSIYAREPDSFTNFVIKGHSAHFTLLVPCTGMQGLKDGLVRHYRTSTCVGRLQPVDDLETGRAYHCGGAFSILFFCTGYTCHSHTPSCRKRCNLSKRTGIALARHKPATHPCVSKIVCYNHLQVTTVYLAYLTF